MNRKTICSITFLGLVALGIPSEGRLLAQSNIDPAHQFAWCENVGWTNWLDANGSADGVFVDTAGGFLTGFVWGENIGWINVGNGAGPYANTDDTNFGVNILGDDDLDGFAWGENIGWINFSWGAATDEVDRARFDSGAGRFRGYAWGENIGWINLDDAMHYVGVAGCAEGQLYGDVEPPLCPSPAAVCDPVQAGDCDADVDDILYVLDTFSGLYDPATADLEPCSPDGMHGDGDCDVDDILGVLDAFSGTQQPDCVAPCPGCP